MTGADLELGPFSITVHCRQFPDSIDFWDGNWLVATAAVNKPDARVEVSGAILRNTEIESFRDQLEGLIEAGSGRAKLDCLEPNLNVEITLDRLGRADVKVDITPDHLNESHIFRFARDQTYLSLVRSACASILRRYPITGA